MPRAHRTWVAVAFAASLSALAGCALDVPTSPDRCGGEREPCCARGPDAGLGAGMCRERLVCHVEIGGLPGSIARCMPCPGLLCGGACVRSDDPAHCGECGHACRRGESCRGGRCVSPCEPQFLCVRHDDQGEYVVCDDGCGCNGCPEGAFCTGTSCRPFSCAGFWCDHVCIQGGSDPMNCGGCGFRCGEGQQCSYGQCRQFTCPAGQSVCDNQCVDTRTSAVHCGGCQQPCDDHCEGGVCRCTAPRVRCGGRCVDTSTSREHCGACDHACSFAAGEVCVGGACRCPGGQVVCANACRDLRTSFEHCGACDHRCAQGAACVGGRCACAAEQEVCDDGGVPRCVDTRSNSGHCGGCGRACAAGEVCASGRCGAMCDPGLARCEGAGCRDLQHDARHCGACGAACPAAGAVGFSGMCDAGRCTCQPGRFDCDGDRTYGCESTRPCP